MGGFGAEEQSIIRDHPLGQDLIVFVNRFTRFHGTPINRPHKFFYNVVLSAKSIEGERYLAIPPTNHANFILSRPRGR